MCSLNALVYIYKINVSLNVVHVHILTCSIYWNSNSSGGSTTLLHKLEGGRKCGGNTASLKIYIFFSYSFYHEIFA